MRFAFTGGQYTEFRGYVFAWGKPTTIQDQATIDALLKRDDFKRIPDEKAQEITKAESSEILMPDACPKCGKIVRRGKAMHQKWCGGK